MPARKTRTTAEPVDRIHIPYVGGPSALGPEGTDKPVYPAATKALEVEVVIPFEERRRQAIAFAMEVTDGTGVISETDILSVFARGEYTVFVYRLRQDVLDDSDPTQLPQFVRGEVAVLQAVARFLPRDERWEAIGQGPRAPFLRYA